MILTLCGSTRFQEQFEKTNRDLTLWGHTVYSVGFFMHMMPPEDQKAIGFDDSNKIYLDLVHLQKILQADGIVVVNPEGYIGESTRREIAWAILNETLVFYTHQDLVEYGVESFPLVSLSKTSIHQGIAFLKSHLQAEMAKRAVAH